MKMEKIQEKQLKGVNGWIMVAVVLILLIGGTVAMCIGFALVGGDEIPENPAFFALAGAGCVILIVGCIMLNGFKIIAPNEAAVLTLFGKYHGSLKTDGFFFVNPFCKTVNPASPFEKLGKKISLKAMTLNNDKQKVNDEEGNPIEISVVVIWRIKDTARAVFAVDNYMTFISTQCDSAIRQVARQYPYDVSDNGDEKSLRGSSQEIADVLQAELQERVNTAGIEILDARINNLAYATEIAAAMLQRQQAAAIIAARQKIVDGAVSMVEMALTKLSENNIVELDDERKAQMVSNLLVVLCGNRDAQPVVNSGSIY
ncbi:MAG: SPFH domain-containing protein [Clostridiales bacterium]|nr:SPFH domain-containing protein [Clostridiales bacterium]